MRFKLSSLIAVVGLATAFPHVTVADDATWNDLGGTNDWNDPASWTPNTTFPNGAGQVANLTNDITSDATINLQQAITIGTLNLGDPNGSNRFRVNSGSGTNTLTFEGTNAAINLGSVLEQSHEINAPVALNSALSINLGGIDSTNAQRLSIGSSGGITTNNNAITVTGGIAGETQLTLSGDLVGGGTFTSNSASVINVVGTKSFTGTIVLNRFASASNAGSLTLTNGSIRNAAEVVLNGAQTGSAQLGGVLWQGNNSGFGTLPGQRLPEAKVTFNGGHLQDRGQRMNAGFESTWIENDVETLRYNSAFSSHDMAASTTTAGTRLNVDDVQRGEGATVFFRATSAVNQYLADDGATHIVGQNGTGTSTGVVPWMAGSTNISNLGLQGFATYSATDGFRVLSGTEQTGTVIANANVQVNAVDSLGSDLSVNSLRLNNASTSDIGAGRTLTIQSGGLMFTSNNNHFGVAGDANGDAGTLNFGAAEGVVWTALTNTNGIGAVIAGSGGLTKAGTGTLVLTGENTYTGETHVSGGTLRVGDGAFASTLGDDDVQVHNGALLDILSEDVIDDDEALLLDAYGLFNGKVNIAEELIEIVAALSLGGEFQAAGYYGSSDAAAANGSLAVNVNNTFFSGDGLIQVVPEPASLALLGAGFVLAFGRRRV